MYYARTTAFHVVIARMHLSTYVRFSGDDEVSEDTQRVFPTGDNTWMVRDARLAQMSLNTDWSYYGAVDRFLKVRTSSELLCISIIGLSRHNMRGVPRWLSG